MLLYNDPYAVLLGGHSSGGVRPARGGGLPCHRDRQHGHHGLDLEEFRAHATDGHDRSLRALAALPLSGGRLHGAVVFGYQRAHPWLAERRAMLGAAVELIGQAVIRPDLYETQYGTSHRLYRETGLRLYVRSQLALHNVPAAQRATLEYETRLRDDLGISVDADLIRSGVCG